MERRGSRLRGQGTRGAKTHEEGKSCTMTWSSEGAGSGAEGPAGLKRTRRGKTECPPRNHVAAWEDACRKLVSHATLRCYGQSGRPLAAPRLGVTRAWFC